MDFLTIELLLLLLLVLLLLLLLLSADNVDSDDGTFTITGDIESFLIGTAVLSRLLLGTPCEE